MIDTSLLAYLGLLILVLGVFRFASQGSKETPEQQHPLHDEKLSQELSESAMQKYRKSAFKDALHDVDDALERDPESKYLLWLRAKIYLELENYQLVIQDAERILAKDDLYHWAYELRGFAYFFLKQFDKASRDFEQTIALQADYVMGYVGLFAIAEEEKQEERLERYFKKIMTLNKGLNALLHFFYQRKQPEAIIKYANKALEKGQKAEIGLLTLRAWAYQSLNQHSEAVTDLKRGLELKPDDEHLHVLRASSLQSLNDFEGAAKSFESYLAKKPDAHEALYNYALCLRELARYTEILRIAEKLLLMKPDKTAYINLEGLAYLGLHDFEKALASFEKILQLKSDDWVYYHNRSVAYRRLNQLDKAWQDAEKALELGSEEASIYSHRAMLFFVEGKREEALESSQKAIELNTDNERIQNYHTHILMLMGNFDLALASNQKAREAFTVPHWRHDAYEALIEEARGNREIAKSFWQKAVSKEARHWDENWLIHEYELSAELIPIAQKLLQSEKP